MLKYSCLLCSRCNRRGQISISLSLYIYICNLDSRAGPPVGNPSHHWGNRGFGIASVLNAYMITPSEVVRRSPRGYAGDPWEILWATPRDPKGSRGAPRGPQGVLGDPCGGPGKSQGVPGGSLGSLNWDLFSNLKISQNIKIPNCHNKQSKPFQNKCVWIQNH